MKASLTRIWKKTHNEAYLMKAVAKGWITEEEKAEIMAS